MWTRTFQVVGSVPKEDNRGVSGGWDLEVAGSNSFRALKAFSLNERGAIRELVTGCRVLEGCLGCCVSELGLQWEDCMHAEDWRV